MLSLEAELEARPGRLAELFLGRVVQVVILDAVQGRGGGLWRMSLRKRFVPLVTLGARCQRLLTLYQIRKASVQAAAYLMAVSVLLTLRASAKSFAPASLMLFPETLPTRRAQACQRLLTLSKSGS